MSPVGRHRAGLVAPTADEIRDHRSIDLIGLTPDPVSQTSPTPEGTPARDLHLVEPDGTERPDHPQQRLVFQSRCEWLARRLATTPRLEDRIQIYCVGFTARELTTAAALRPDLMPTLNDEWKALSSADLD
jgi:hypothetical protein